MYLLYVSSLARTVGGEDAITTREPLVRVS